MRQKQRSRASSGVGSQLHIGNLFAAGVVGFAVGLLVCWFFMVRPMFATLDAREESLREWERINRQERQAIADLKTISIEELRHWVSTLDNQHTQYTKLVSRLHEQQLQLVGPSTTHLWIAMIAVFGVGGLGLWAIRDSNAAAAQTLHNAVAVLPSLEEALRENRGAIDYAIESEWKQLATPEQKETESAQKGAAVTSIRHGTIKTFFESKGYGFIVSDDGEEIFFHKRAMRGDSEAEVISEGMSVSFKIGKDADDRPCAEDVQIDE